MTIPSNQAQPAQIPNLFEHRFDSNQVRDPLDVQDAFNLIAEHAQGVLELLYIQFDDKGRVSDELIQCSIDSVVFQIKDMKSIINAYFAAIKQEKEALNERQ
jgi:hypothetical protein